MRARALIVAFGACLALVPTAAASPRSPARYFSWDTASHVARLTLIAGLGTENNGYNFDGYGRGEMLVQVPLRWRVVVECENPGGARNSCTVVSGSLATTPAFRGASTPDPITGLSGGTKATFSFVASRTGSFRIASIVPGHEQARQFAVLEIERNGKPAITARPGP